MSLAPLSDEWLAGLIEATANRASAGGLKGTVTLTVPRMKLTVQFNDGKVVGAVPDEVGTVLPFTGKQYDEWCAGSLNLSAAYTKGDLRAVGPTGPLLAALEVLDDPAVRTALSE